MAKLKELFLFNEINNNDDESNSNMSNKRAVGSVSSGDSNNDKDSKTSKKSNDKDELNTSMKNNLKAEKNSGVNMLNNKLKVNPFEMCYGLGKLRNIVNVSDVKLKYDILFQFLSLGEGVGRKRESEA